MTTIAPLTARHVERMQTVQGLALEAGIQDLQPLVVQPAFEGAALVRARQRDWLFATPEHDPLIRRGDLPIPLDQRRRLEKLVEAGIEFDRYYIAHELAERTRELDEVESGRVPVGPERARELVQPAPPTERALESAQRAGRAAEKAIRGIKQAGEATVEALASSGAGLDPIVFGVIIDNSSEQGRTVGAWYPLAVWRW